MSDLKVPKSHEALQGAAELVLRAIRDDGRVRIAPKGSIYPCHMALAAEQLFAEADMPVTGAYRRYWSTVFQTDSKTTGGSVVRAEQTTENQNKAYKYNCQLRAQ